MMDEPMNTLVRLWVAGFGLAVWAGLFWGMYWLLSLPLRRRERALLFLELLDTGMAQGRSAEETIRGIAGAHDPMLGRPLDRLGSYVDSGVTLADAVQSETRLLPRQVREMLRAGAELGDYRKVIPACRRLLGDARSRVMSAINFVAIFPLVFFGVGGVLGFLVTFVVPKFREIYADLLGNQAMAAWMEFMTRVRFGLVIGLTVLQLLMFVFIAAYAGGERLKSLLWPWLARLVERVVFLFPWRRKRMKRDFCAMLALLLDAGVPEARAVELAASCTANTAFMKRAAKVVEKLKSGVKLPEALAVLDDAGEFRWRWRNVAIGEADEAVGPPVGFAEALAGWCEALDAKAYQQEQAVSQVVTTALVLVNGAVVGMIAIGLFLPLIEIVRRLALW